MQEVTYKPSQENRCSGLLKIVNKGGRLLCAAAGCPVADTSGGEIIGKFPNDPTSSASEIAIKAAAVLEIPDVCPRLADFNTFSRRERLPENLR
ncbi:hypothetical protein BH10PAT3_BH10PAT3_6280 [soil metagenome]